jgi:hypothetical protein
MVEFVIALSVLSLIFTGILYFGLAGTRSLAAEVEARNKAFRQQGVQNTGLFRKYVNETPEMARFLMNYEMKINPAGLNFRQVCAEAECTVDQAAFPSLARGFRYRTRFAMDCPDPAINREMKADAVETLARDLFGITDRQGGNR